MKNIIILLLLVSSCPAYADEHLTYHVQKDTYPDRLVYSKLDCWGSVNKHCRIYMGANPSSPKDIYLKGAFIQEVHAVEETMEWMKINGVNPRCLSDIETTVDDLGVRDKIALTARASAKWEQSEYNINHHKPVTGKKFHAAVMKVMESSGAFDPLKEMLGHYGLAMKIVYLENISTDKFSNLHIYAPEVQGKDTIQVPINALISISVEEK